MNEKRKNPIARFLFSADRPLNGKRMIHDGSGVETISVTRYIISELITFAAALVFSMLWHVLTFAAVSETAGLTDYWLLRTVLLAYLFAAILLPKKGRWINTAVFFGLILILMVGSLLFDGGIFETLSVRKFLLGAVESFRWTFNLTTQKPENIGIYWTIVSTLVAWLAIRVFPNIVVTGSAWILPWFFIAETEQGRFGLGFMMAGLACVLIALGRQSVLRANWRRKRQEPAPAVVAVVLLATFLLQSVLTPEMFYSETLKEKLDNIFIREHQPDIIQYYEFSLDETGYYPMHQRLGGPVDLEKKLYMRVFGTERPFLLRGAVYDKYDGKLWHQVKMKPNEVFRNDPDKRSDFQNQAFTTDENYMAADNRFYMKPEAIRIFPLNDPTQVIFSPGKPTRIKQLDSAEDADPMYAYFNRDGQLYADSDINGEGYTVYGEMFNRHAMMNLDPASQSGPHRSSDDPYYEEIRQKYAQSYEGLANMVAGDSVLSQQLETFKQQSRSDTDDLTDRLGFLYRMTTYLSSSYRYDTDMPYPEANEDILERFFTEHRGYCVYFATAITLLAREIGLPARYVEGFSVPGIDADPNSSTDSYMRQIYTDTSHAWSEVYVPRIGWIPVEATPGSHVDDLFRDEAKQQEHDRTSTTTTTTTSAPTRRPDRPEVTPPSQPTPPQDSRQTQSSPALKIALGVIFGVLLLLLLLYLWISNRGQRLKNKHDIAYMYEKYHNNDRDVIDAVWQDMKAIHRLAGGTLEPYFNLDESMRKIAGDFELTPRYDVLDSIMDKVYYAEVDPSQAEVEYIFSLYDAVERGLKERLSRPKWLLRRFLF